MLIDQFGRHIDYLRISVTDRCNFRCTYCMPEDMTFADRRDNLKTSELELICQAFVELGVKKVRLTGGEPLIHPEFEELLHNISKFDGLEKIAITTNGSLLASKIDGIKSSKVTQLNISLDSMNEEVFSEVTRVGKLEQVLAGIDAAVEAGIQRIRLNVVVSNGVNESELLDLVDYAVGKGIHIAFIEEMPLGDMAEYKRSEKYLSNDDVRAQLSESYNLIPQTKKLLQSGPARYYQVVNSVTEVGFISPHSDNFCGSCNRVRITREGNLILCLGQNDAVDLRALIRASNSPLEDIKQAITAALSKKPKKHTFDTDDDGVQVVRFMNVTGG